MTERWRPLPEDGYQVSDKGRVRGPRGQVLVGWPDRNGYYRVDIRRRTRFVHQLVLETWVGPRPDGHETRHLNDDKADNRLVNLAWGTKSENTLDRIANGLHVQARKTRCPTWHPYDEANTYRRPNGWRGCRACRRDQQRQRRAAA